ncbi:MAG: hypothetical protein M3O07_04750 [Pseudomonadota bacterium]|nr:hypothetical protein [Pseudomonadota bacterium]
MIPILGLQRFQLLVEIGVLAARCLAVGIGAVMESKIAAIALFSAAGVGANIIIIAVVLRRATAHDQRRLESPRAS